MNEQEEVNPVVVLEALWSALKENYPAFELVVGATGDAWRDEFLARLEPVSCLPDAYLILEELVNRFHDYHTGLHWPDKPLVLSPPGVRLGWVEGRIAVIAATQISTAPLLPGDMILSVDGTDALLRYQQKLEVARGATSYARQAWACDSLLEGAPDSRVALRVERIRGKRGSRRTLELECKRSMTTPRESLDFMNTCVECIEARRERDDVGYIRIPSWRPKSEADLLARFDAVLEDFKELPYLLIDVRDNRGGSDDLSDQVTGRFLREPIVSSISFIREAGTNHYEKMVSIAEPRGPWRYEGRVAVLTNEDCASACGHFVNAMRASGEVRLVGRPTSGCCGWSKFITLPGGATLRCSLTLPIHGTQTSALNGIQPHRLVLPTLEALRSGRDLVIEEAITYLRSESRP